MNIYEEIGPDRLADVLRSFYLKSFRDPMLAHFFWNSDHEQLLKMQLAFVTSMLGGPVAYSGKSLSQAHDGLNIRPPHFLRRQRLLQETMAEAGLSTAVIQAWLAQEERLKPLIMNDQQTCMQHPQPPKPGS